MGQPPFVAVPEEALRRRAEVSSGAFDLYEQYCKHRNRDTGRCDPSNRLLAEELGITTGHVADLKTELVERGWIRRRGWRAVDLLVGEFPRPKVFSMSPGAPEMIGKFRQSQPETAGQGPEMIGNFRSSGEKRSEISDQFGPRSSEISDHCTASPLSDQPVGSVQPMADQPAAAAAAAAAVETTAADPLREAVDEQFVSEVIEAGVYPVEHVKFVWGKLQLHCRGKRTVPSRRQLLHWLATERHTPQQSLFGGAVGDIPAGKVVATKRCDISCPLCYGTSFQVVEGRGARRCPNMASAEEPASVQAQPLAVNGGESGDA